MAMVYRYGSFGTKPESDKGNGFYFNGILLQVLIHKKGASITVRLYFNLLCM